MFFLSTLLIICVSKNSEEKHLFFSLYFCVSSTHHAKKKQLKQLKALKCASIHLTIIIHFPVEVILYFHLSPGVSTNKNIFITSPYLKLEQNIFACTFLSIPRLLLELLKWQTGAPTRSGALLYRENEQQKTLQKFIRWKKNEMTKSKVIWWRKTPVCSIETEAVFDIDKESCRRLSYFVCSSRSGKLNNVIIVIIVLK